MPESKHVLTLIEPDPAVREAITVLLEVRGWTVDALVRGESLQSALKSDDPLAVICEAHLPDMSSTEILECCRKSRTPVIFLGHEDDVQHAVDLIRLGAEDYLQKPFQQNRLLNLLERLADLRKG